MYCAIGVDPTKAHGLHGVVVEDRVHRVLVAVDDLQDAIGQPGLLTQFGQHHRAGRVALGRFQDHRIARGQRRAHLPQGDHGGKVEGRDARDHAQGLAHGIHVDAGTGAVGELAFQQMRRADAEFDHLKPALHIALGVGKGLAMFAADGFGQLVHVAVDEAHQRHHHAGAALRVGGAPCDLRAGGGGDGGVHLGLAGKRHLRLHLARGRVHHIGHAPRGARHALAVDPVSDLFHLIPPLGVCLLSGAV
jgi:hypothetical protein